ncbi:hypothetical protein ACQ4PT_003049 [Festuca glaucescens]
MGSDGGSGDDGKSRASGEVATGMSSDVGKSPASGGAATGKSSDGSKSPASGAVATGMASDDGMSPAPGAVATGKSSDGSKSLASGALATGMGSDDGKSPAPGAVATLTIRWATGGKFTVLADLGSTVGMFKEIVTKSCYVPAPRQCLIYKGRILKDEQTLKSYGVETDHTIHLVRESGDSPQLITPSHSGGFRGLLSGHRSTGGASSLGSFWDHVEHFVRQNPNLQKDIENMPMLLKVLNSPEIQRNIAALTNMAAVASPYCHFAEEATITAVRKTAVNNISTRERMGRRGLGVADIRSLLHDLFGPAKGNVVGGFSFADYGLIPGGTPDGSLLSQLLSPAAIKIFYDTFADPQLLNQVHYFSRLVHL